MIVFPGEDGIFQQDTMHKVTLLEMSDVGWKSMTKTSKCYPGPLIPQT